MMKKKKAFCIGQINLLIINFWKHALENFVKYIFVKMFIFIMNQIQKKVKRKKKKKKNQKKNWKKKPKKK
ncbi:MAG: hypothetical protein CML42_06710 [Rhodobacteraceae bacterium]|nr:hypothetical protein [Paracoccaceae bacterium]